MDDLSPYLGRVTAVANGKGGAGKTSSTVNIAGLAARSGWRVLLIDLDPQGNAGEDLGYSDDPDRDDRGRMLYEAITAGTGLRPSIKDVRPNLDVIAGGDMLDDLESVLVGRNFRSAGTHRALAEPLSQIASDYDLILIDTPPTRPTLLQLALTCARWIIIPTKSDRASIKGLSKLARQLEPVREHRPDIEVLGAVLFGVTSGASTVRANALEDIRSALGGSAPVFNTVIRASEATATESRYDGKLVHEIAEAADEAEPYWEALKAGRKPTRQVAAAPRLAGDYIMLTEEILGAITASIELAESGVL